MEKELRQLDILSYGAKALIPLEDESKALNSMGYKALSSIPSAHDPNKTYHPRLVDGHWICDSDTGPCDHYRIYKTACRHILQARFLTLQDLYKHICNTIKEDRLARDYECNTFDDVINMMDCYRTYEMNRLATLFMNICIVKDIASSDDLHDATNEAYYNDCIIGSVVGSLLRSGYIEVVGLKKSVRDCSHHRRICLYKLTDNGFKVLSRLKSGD